jgi:hypothetical protein
MLPHLDLLIAAINKTAGFAVPYSFNCVFTKLYIPRFNYPGSIYGALEVFISFMTV